VAAARAAFEGPWSKFTPVQRQNVLLQLADLITAGVVPLMALKIFKRPPQSVSARWPDAEVHDLRLETGLYSSQGLFDGVLVELGQPTLPRIPIDGEVRPSGALRRGVR
jgi:hypothetical protein